MSEPKEPLYTWQFFLLCMSNFLFSASFSMLIPELPDYLARMGGQAYLGYIISLFTLTAGLSRPFSGKLTDHLGRIPVMAFGSLVCFLCGALYPFIHTVLGFLLLRLLHGMSTGTKPTATAAYVADIIPEHRRGEAQGSLGIFTATGMSLGPAIGSPMAEHWGMNTLFFFSSFCALGSILILMRMKETLPKSMKRSFSFSLMRIGWKDVYEPKIRPVFWVMFLVSFSSGAISTLIPDLSRHLGWQNKGLYFTVYTIASIGVRFFFAKSSDRYGRQPVLFYACGFLMAAMFLLAFLPNAWGFWTSALCFGIAWGFNTPTLTAWTNDLGSPLHMGRAMATMYIALEAGIGLGAYVSGWIYQGDPAKLGLPFFISGILAILAMLLLLKNRSQWNP